MKRWLLRIAFVLAIAILLATVVNASWLGEAPPGRIKLIAHRGVAQQFDHRGLENDTCTATRIEPPVHDYLENTVRSMVAARHQGANMVEIDIAPTADGKIAIFHDWTLDCRTNGTGNVRDKTLTELQQLDIGYGYTADGGKTFPLRGSEDRIPSLEEALAALPRTPILYNFKSKNAAEADLLAAALKAAGRDVERIGDGFYGVDGPVDRIRQHFPKAWAWSKQGVKACSKQYLLRGWTTRVPDACHGGTIVVPLNLQWAFWGWPNLLLGRMNDAGARVLQVGPYGEDKAMGLTLPEQLGDIPSSFNGYVWVEDIWTIGPALRPKWDSRSRPQQRAAEAGLGRRRQRAQ